MYTIPPVIGAIYVLRPPTWRYCDLRNWRPHGAASAIQPLGMAPGVGTCRALLRLRARDPQDDLYERTRSKRSIARLRKIIKTRGISQTMMPPSRCLTWPSKMPPAMEERIAWTAAMGQFAIQLGARFPRSAS
jgi:hypothetical protein